MTDSSKNLTISDGLEIRNLPETGFGAQIAGLDPGHITDAQRSTIWDTYRRRHGLICFSFDRLLEADELHALTAVFGDNEFAPGMINGYGRAALAGEAQRSVEEQVTDLQARGIDPYMAFIGNVNPATLETRPVDEKFFGEWEWHSDMSYIQVPPTFSLLHARDIPANGGDTGFCNQVMAAAALPSELRARVVELRIKHDSTYTSSGVLRPGMSLPTSPIEASGYPHPVIRRVPTTGEDALFLGRRTNGYVVGMSLAESERLLDELWSHATAAQFCYRHHWQPGQVVVWDNRMMLHMRYPMENTAARLMWRTQTRGEAVVASSATTEVAATDK